MIQRIVTEHLDVSRARGHVLIREKETNQELHLSPEAYLELVELIHLITRDDRTEAT